MIRVPRIFSCLRTALAVALLSLCLLVLASWVKSLWRTDGCAIWIKGVDRWFVQDYGGRVFLSSTPDGWIWALSSDRPENPPRFQMMWLHNRVTSGFTPGDAPWRYAGFHHSVFRESPASSIVSYAYAVPHWFLVLITGPPGYGLARSGLLARRRRLRIAYGLCPVCGYDLRASPVRCPECGTPRHAETLHDPI